MKYFFLLITVVVGFQSFSQNIKRKGSLGVAYYQKTPDSLIAKLQYEKGAVVQFAVPNTTAASIGIKKDDIIVKINSTSIETPTQIVSEARKFRSGDPVEITVIRNKEIQILKGIVIERPKETSEIADVVYGEFPYKNGFVRTIYKSLKGKKPIGTIYFLQGLPCYSMDNFQALDKTKQAIDAMVERGFAVYRMEKGDMGDNVNTPPCEPMGFVEELDMYDAGYKNLLSLKEVDASAIFLFGHSMGGITAPLLAEKYQPKGVVVYGTGFKPWQEYLFDAFLIQSQYYGEDLGKLRMALEKYKPYIYDYFYHNKSIEEIAKDPMGLMALQQVLSYNPETGLVASGRSPLTFKELNQQPLAKAWGNYENDVLAIYGECDIAANNEKDHIALIDYVNKKNPGNGTFWLAPKTTHTFEEIGSMEEFIKWQSNPQAFQQYAASKFNPKVFDYTCDWMKTIAAKPKKNRVKPLFTDISERLPDVGSHGASMDVKAVDINDDGHLDVILANEFQANTILINDGKGNFINESEKRLPQVVHDSEDIAAADFNGDGLVDLVFCSEDDKVHEYYLNQGQGIFKEAAFKLPNSEANAVIAADFNNDKKMDLLLGNNGQSLILINQGNGDFKEEPNRLPIIKKVTQDVALIDMDKDGDMDLFLANEDGNLLYKNNGKGYFTDCTTTHLPQQNDDLETRKIALSDVDRDGDMDVFLANVNFLGTKNPQNRLYINNGKGKFTDETSQRLPKDEDHTIDAIFEDVNNDKIPDLILGNVFGGPIKAFTNNGKGVFSDATETIFGKKIIDALGVIAADFDGDGLNEIYFCDRNNPIINNKDVLLHQSKKIAVKR